MRGVIKKLSISFKGNDFGVTQLLSDDGACIYLDNNRGMSVEVDSVPVEREGRIRLSSRLAGTNMSGNLWIGDEGSPLLFQLVVLYPGFLTREAVEEIEEDMRERRIGF